MRERDINTHVVIDEGVNETESHVMTAIATVVVDKDIPFIQDTFSTFELYKDTVRVRLEIDK